MDKQVAFEQTSLAGVWQCNQQRIPRTGRITTLKNIYIEFFPEGAFQVIDSENRIFQNLASGKIFISDNLLQIRDRENILVGTYQGKLTFLGNFLTLTEQQSKIESLFSRVFQLNGDTLKKKLINKEPLPYWELIGAREKGALSVITDSIQNKKDFLYLTFSADSFYVEKNNQGFVKTTAGSFAVQSDTLSLINTQKTEIYKINYRPWLGLIRLWPLNSGNFLTVPEIKSNPIAYYACRLSPKKHPDAKNLNQLLGYWRGDTVNSQETHYGRFYDINFLESHEAITTANTEKIPGITGWQVNSGQLMLNLSGNIEIACRYHFTSPNRLLLLSEKINGLFVVSDRSNILKNPLARFSDRSYLHIISGHDTLRFYDSRRIRKDTGDVCLLEYFNSEDSTFAGLTAKKPPGNMPNQIGFHSSEQGFGFGFQIKENGVSTHFSIDTAAPDGMRIRSWITDTKNVFDGAFSSGKAVSKSGKSPAVSGTFRFNLSDPPSLNSKFWDKIKRKP